VGCEHSATCLAAAASTALRLYGHSGRRGEGVSEQQAAVFYTTENVELAWDASTQRLVSQRRPLQLYGSTAATAGEEREQVSSKQHFKHTTCDREDDVA